MTSDPPSAAPGIIEALVDLADDAEGLADRMVYDATSAAGNEGDSKAHALFVGLDDPDDESGNAAESELDWANAPGRSVTETGTVTCIARSLSPEADPAAARAGVYATLTALRDAVAPDRTLGLPYVQSVRLPGTTQLVYVEDSDSGVFAVLTFTVFFRARITT